MQAKLEKVPNQAEPSYGSRPSLQHTIQVAMVQFFVLLPFIKSNNDPFSLAVKSLLVCNIITVYS